MMADVTYCSMDLETQTIELQRFVRLAEYHYAEHDPRDSRSTSNLELATDLLTDKVTEFIAWLETNGRSSIKSDKAT